MSRQMFSDDDWCECCGESHPCSCDDMEAGWFEDDDDEDEGNAS